MSAQAQLLGFYNNFPDKYNYKFDDIIDEVKKNDEFNSNMIIPQINLFEKDNSGFDKILFSEKFECKVPKQMIAKNMEKYNELKIFNKIDEIREKFNKKYIQIFEKELISQIIQNYIKECINFVIYIFLFISMKEKIRKY
jgi:hypothetical protein